MTYEKFTLPTYIPEPSMTEQMDSYMTNFKGSNKIQRGGGWTLKGGGSTTSTFLGSSINYSIIPTATNTYTLGDASYKFSDIYAVKINGVTPQSGTQTVYVAASSGGAVTTAISFNTGIKTS